MKRNLFYAFALCLMMSSLVGCDIDEMMDSLRGEEEKEEMTIPPYFKDGTIHVRISADVPTTNTFKVETNQPWVITEKPSWCELDVMEGVGETVVNITVQTSTKNHRIGYIKVYSEEMNSERTVEVNQYGNTLSVITGDYIGSEVTLGAFKGTNNQIYKYEHKIKVEYTINGSHLASEWGVTGSTFNGFIFDGTHEATITLLSNSAAASFTYQAFAQNKKTGEKVYGEKKDIVSRQ